MQAPYQTLPPGGNVALPPGYPGAPPIPGEAAAQLYWNAGYYNPLANVQNVQQPWAPGVGWFPPGPDRNLAKRLPTGRPPSPSYWNTKLSDNGLGLEGMVKRKDPSEYGDEEPQTPWIWNPPSLLESEGRATPTRDFNHHRAGSVDDGIHTTSAALVREHGQSSRGSSQEGTNAQALSQTPKKNRSKPLAANEVPPFPAPKPTVPHGRSASTSQTMWKHEPEEFTSKVELHPTFSSNIIRTPNHYQQSRRRMEKLPSTYHSRSQFSAYPFLLERIRAHADPLSRSRTESMVAPLISVEPPSRSPSPSSEEMLLSPLRGTPTSGSTELSTNARDAIRRTLPYATPSAEGTDLEASRLPVQESSPSRSTRNVRMGPWNVVHAYLEEQESRDQSVPRSAGASDQTDANPSLDHPVRYTLPNDLTNHITRDGHDPVASGGFADIYRAILQENGKTIRVAIKAIKIYSGEDRNFAKKQKRLRREIKVWLNLSHANVLPLLGTTLGFGRFSAMVCPWAENGTLTSYLEDHYDRLSVAETLGLINSVASGLKYLHSCSVVHGDLSGSNVLIFENGIPCIADFGLSMLLTQMGASTFATSFHARGTLRWTAPELLALEEGMEEELRGPTTQSDVYSFGSIMLQILSGKVPYHYYTRDAQVIHAVSRGMTPKRPSTELVTDRRWTFIQRCWSRTLHGVHARPSSGVIVEFSGEELAGTHTS